MSEKINLNDDTYDVSSSIIFNKGNAGKVENVAIDSVEKADKSDGSNVPDWKITYRDSDGGTINEGYYYLDTKHEKYKNHLKYQGAALRHLIHAVFGEDTKLPEFETAKEMLDKCMTQISKADPGKLYRLAVNYGRKDYTSTYLRVRRFPEFIEPMSVSAEESRIVFGPNELLDRPVKDEEESTTAFATSGTVVDKSSDAPSDTSGFSTTPKDGQDESDDLPF